MAKQDAELGTSLSIEALQAMMVEVVKAAKEPNAYEKKKLDALLAKELAIAKGKEVSIHATHAAKMMRLYNCMHEKEDGRLDLVAQVNSDGFVRPVCQLCGSVLPAFKATPEMVSNGVNLQSKELQKRLRLEHLFQMHKLSFPDCHDHCCDLKVRKEQYEASQRVLRESGKSAAV